MVWLEVSNEVAGQMLVGAAISMSKVFIHMTVQLVLIVGWRLYFLPSWASLKGYLSVLAAWQLASPRVSDPWDQDWNCNPFYDLGSQVKHYHFCHILLDTEELWPSVGRDYSRSWIPGGEGLWVPSRSLLPIAFFHPPFPVCSAIPICFILRQAYVCLPKQW